MATIPLLVVEGSLSGGDLTFEFQNDILKLELL